MTHLGKGVKDRRLKRVSSYLDQYLSDEENIIAIFSASRFRRPISGLVLTDHRLITVKGIFTPEIRVVDEIAADDISELNSENGVGKAIKLYVTKRDGEKIFISIMPEVDVRAAKDMLFKMSGRTQTIADKIKNAKSLTPAEKIERKKLIEDRRKAERLAEKEQSKKLKKTFGLFVTNKTKKEAEVKRLRELLREDRELLVTSIVAVIKRHWTVLEDKLEQYTEEDEYGNVSLGIGFKKEFIYFCRKVVQPHLEDVINKGGTTNKSITLILQDTLSVLQHSSGGYDLNFSDDNTVIANKFLSALIRSTTSDDLLYGLSKGIISLEVYNEGSEAIFMDQSLITLQFQDSLRTSEPFSVTPFDALIYTLFFNMHNNKPAHSESKDSPVLKDYIGNDPYKYEEYIRQALRSNGFAAKRTRGSGDYGVDVMAHKNGKTFAIQCKLYNHPVGTKAVQEIVSGRIFYGADHAIVVSDNTFTNAAKILARKSSVILTHHRNLLAIIERLESSQNVINSSQIPIESGKQQFMQPPTSKDKWNQDDEK